jgi:predicted NodU family carbamoyl transferase
MTFTTRLRPRDDAPRKHQLPSTNHQGDSRRRLTVMLLNTSLNIKGEPLVDTWDDVVRFRDKTGFTVF